MLRPRTIVRIFLAVTLAPAAWCWAAARPDASSDTPQAVPAPASQPAASGPETDGPSGSLMPKPGRFDIERYVNIRASHGAALDPLGGRIAFLTNVTGEDQVWRTDLSGSWPRQVTFGDEPIGSVHWSPANDDLILYTRDIGGNERDQLFLTDLRTGAGTRLTTRDDVIHGFGGWSRDGRMITYRSNERDQAWFDVYTLDLTTGERKRVYQQDGSNFPTGFSPDGRWIVVIRYASSFDADLYLVDLKGGGEPVHLTPHKGWARYDSIEWLPDSDGFFLISDEGRDFMGIARYDLASRSMKFVGKADWDVEQIVLSEDGRTLAVLSNEDGYGKISARDVEGGATRAVEGLPPGIAEGLVLSRSGRRLAFTYAGPQNPSDVWMWEPSSGKLTQITHSSTAGVPPSTFLPAEPVSFKTPDGLRISGFLYRPSGSEGKKIPVLINVHGGPESQSRPWFSALSQYFLQRGFGVFYPNVRGSTGYGNRFSHLDDVGGRLDSVRDLAECAKWLVSSGIAAPGRVGVFGGSYGGYMTLAALTFHPDLWACGVDLVGISDLRTFIANTGPWRRAIRAAEYGDPDRDGEVMDKASPIHFADRITAPLMVIQGANDPRVPQSEADQIVEAVRKRGGTVEYLLFPDEGHGLGKLENRLKAYAAMADFIEKHLVGD